MNTLELKNELHQLIESSDAGFVAKFHTLAKEQLLKWEQNKRIEASEIDIKKGNIHSQDEVEKIVKSWKEK
ncbi:MAG: hypothetical protein ACOVLC_00460 [Flavobacterium sp.]